LLLWLADLRKDKQPGLYPETQYLSPSEIAAVMSLARFVGKTLYPGEALPLVLRDYRRRLMERIGEEQARQTEHSRKVLQESASFGDLVRRTIDALEIDRSVLRESLTIPQLALSELEDGSLPPHRLPMDKMVGLLAALRLWFREVVDLVRASSLRWADEKYGSAQTQLGRVDISLKSEARREVLQDEPDIAKEAEHIETYCSGLAKLLSEP
jgi:hypothetical protein